MRRLLILIGVLSLVSGFLWPWLEKSSWWRWIGRLPGDIRIEREGSFFFFPITMRALAGLYGVADLLPAAAA